MKAKQWAAWSDAAISPKQWPRGFRLKSLSLLERDFTQAVYDEREQCILALRALMREATTARDASFDAGFNTGIAEAISAIMSRTR